MVKIDPILSRKLVGVNVLLTILIVWLHVSANYDIPKPVSDIAIISVPCFFTLSSFLYFRSFDFTNPLTSYKSKVISRSKSLLIPFIAFNVFGILFSLLAYQVHPLPTHPLSGLSWSNILPSLYESKFNGPLWYLRSLFAFILIAPIIGYVIRTSKWTILLLIPIYYFCQKIRYFYFPYWMVDIFIGAYIAIYYDDITAKSHFFNRSIIKIAAVIISILAMYYIENEYLIRAIAPICMMSVISVMYVFPLRLQSIIAPYSMLIYCLHIPISRITSKIPQLISIQNPILCLVVATIITVIVIIAVGKLLKKMPPIWNFLTGGR